MSSVPKFENNSTKDKLVLSDKDKEILKLIDNFFLKSCLLICSKELSSSDTLREYLNLSESWFEIMNNYQIYDLPTDINQWLHFDGHSTLPPLVIETYLDLRNLPETFLVRLMDKDANLWNVCKGTKRNEIVLERWLLELDNSNNVDSNDTATHAQENYTALNNQISLLLRYLHTLIQLLPINTLIKTLNKKYLSIGTRILDGSKPILSKGRIGLSKPIISSYSNVINESNIPAHLEQKKITPVWTKFGLLRVSVSYRRECKFELQNINQPESDDTNVAQKFKSVNNMSPTSHTLGPRKSTSISPSARASFGFSGTSLDQQQQQQSPITSKKQGGITRQVQPFKVGSVNSLAHEKSNSQMSSRNPSVSSVFASTSARRSSIGSNFAINNPVNINNNILMANNSNSTMASNAVGRVDTGSIDSSSKYLSSFGNIRRHSSINRNIENINSIDRALRSGSEIRSSMKRHSSENSMRQAITNNDAGQNNSNDDLLDFVKLIDSKPEIKIKTKVLTSNKEDKLSHSLLRYQNLKSSNNLLSEDLSMSYTLYHNQDVNNTNNLKNYPVDSRGPNEGRRHSTSSNSKSPLYSLSPYTQNSIKGYNSHYRGFSTSAVGSRKNSLERSHQSLLPPIYGGESMSYHDVETTIEPHHSYRTGEGTTSQDQAYKTGRSQSDEAYSAASHTWRSSRSPRSLPTSDAYSALSGRNRLTYHQNYHISQPTLTSVPAQAKLHRPSLQSADILENEGRRLSHVKSAGSLKGDGKVKEKRNYMGPSMDHEVDVGDDAEDDELMFFMSDMNIGSD